MFFLDFWAFSVAVATAQSTLKSRFDCSSVSFELTGRKEEAGDVLNILYNSFYIKTFYIKHARRTPVCELATLNMGRG